MSADSSIFIKFFISHIQRSSNIKTDTIRDLESNFVRFLTKSILLFFSNTHTFEMNIIAETVAY